MLFRETFFMRTVPAFTIDFGKHCEVTLWMCFRKLLFETSPVLMCDQSVISVSLKKNDKIFKLSPVFKYLCTFFFIIIIIICIKLS